MRDFLDQNVRRDLVNGTSDPQWLLPFLLGGPWLALAGSMRNWGGGGGGICFLPVKGGSAWTRLDCTSEGVRE